MILANHSLHPNQYLLLLPIQLSDLQDPLLAAASLFLPDGGQPLCQGLLILLLPSHSLQSLQGTSTLPDLSSNAAPPLALLKLLFPSFMLWNSQSLLSQWLPLCPWAHLPSWLALLGAAAF